MNEMTKGLTDGDLTFSSFIAGIPNPAAPADAVEAVRLQRGQALVVQHRCDACHNSDLLGSEQIGDLAYFIARMR